jgi:hypothetical protein
MTLVISTLFSPHFSNSDLPSRPDMFADIEMIISDFIVFLVILLTVVWKKGLLPISIFFVQIQIEAFEEHVT